MIIGFWASNADKDVTYRMRIAPHYDPFILSARSLQSGAKVTNEDSMFWIYDALLSNQDPSLKESKISEINKLDCSGASLTLDGKTHNHCTFDIILGDQTSKQIRITDLQQVVDNALLYGPAYRIGKRTFHLGVFLSVLAGIFWLLDNGFLTFKSNKKIVTRKPLVTIRLGTAVPRSW
jgi:hypothetical protein